MSKNFIFRKLFKPLFFTCFFTLSLLITSCKNFLDGGDLLTELEESIKYSNSPEYTISVATTNKDWGNITTGSGDHKKRVSDTISLNFYLNEEFKFIKWKAINKNNNSVSMNSFIDFSSPTEPSTTAKLLQGSDDILITPLCSQIFKVTETSTETGSSSYNRDTTVIITFNQDLAKSTEKINNVKNISIEVSDLQNSQNYFLPPVIDKNKIIISCNPQNLIPVEENSTRTVTITIPSNFCYYCEDVQLDLGQKYTFSYTINSSTTEKTSIQFSQEQNGDTSSIFKIDGVTANGSKSKYSIGQTIKLSYKGSEDYIFSNFISSKEDVVLISSPEYDELSNVYTSTVTVLEGGADIIITPYTTIRNKLTLKFEAENGNLIPIDTKSYFENEKFDLKFTENKGFCFSEFTLLDAENKPVEIDDYLEIDTSKPEQIVTVKKVDAALTLKAIGKERPQVKFILPANGKEGLVRNSSIKIWFSQRIKKEDLLNNSLIKVTQGILISTRQEIKMESQDASDILEYLVNDNCDLLTITLKEDNYFQPNAYINVKISKDVRNENSIPFESDYEFQFQVSNIVDSLAPVINKLYVGTNSYDENYKNDFTIKEYKVGDSEQSRNIENTINKINEAVRTDQTDSYNILDKVITENQKLNFYIQAGDLTGNKEKANSEQDESSVSKIGYKITQVNSFKALKDAPVTNGFSYEDYFDYTGTGGDLKGKTIEGESEKITHGSTFTLDLNNLDGNKKQAPDGVLRIDIYTVDKNDNNSYDEKYWSTHGNAYRTLFVTKDSNAPKITTAKWHKTNFEKDFSATSNGIKDDSYIKFNIEEEMTGISSFKIELKNSSEESINLSSDKKVEIKYNSSDDYQKSSKFSDCTMNEDSITFTPDSTYNTSGNFNKLFTGWYYITGLDDYLNDEENFSLKITIKDGVEHETEVESSIYIDRGELYLKDGETDPKNVKGPYVQEYTFADGNNAENVFPRVGNPGLTGAAFKEKPSIPNGDGNEVRWFYTNTWNSNKEWGVYLKQEFTKSNISEKAPAVILYQKNSDTTLSDAELKKITRESVFNKPTETFTFTSAAAFTKYFGIGTHSFVLMSDSGYISPAYTFVVVKDDKGPEMKTSDNRHLQYLITYDFPNHDSTSTLGNISQKKSASGSSPQFDWCSKDRNGKLDSFRARTYNFKCNTIADCLKNKFIIRLSGSYDSDNNKNKNIYEKGGSPTYHNNGEYWQDAWPSRTSSGISQYYVCRVYSSWRRSSSGHMDDPFIPALPPDTNTNARFLDDIQHYNDGSFISYNDKTGNNKSDSSSIKYDITYSNLNNYFDVWKEYNSGKDIEITPFVKDCFQPGVDSGVYKYIMAPITLFFKDNCGNIDYMLLTVPTWSDFGGFAFKFDVNDIN